LNFEKFLFIYLFICYPCSESDCDDFPLRDTSIITRCMSHRTNGFKFDSNTSKRA